MVRDDSLTRGGERAFLETPLDAIGSQTYGDLDGSPIHRSKEVKA